jgi:hypothetical protein
MTLKKILLSLFISISIVAFSAEPTTTTLKLYGYVGNDFFYNSRQNVEMVDGIIQLFPKPIELSAGADKNAVAQAEMLSVNSRIGIDITGTPVLGAKTSGKIEADFAGFSTTYYVFRIRQAYMKLNWDKTELLIGQTWHPLFGSVVPTTFSANAGAPFQPFNRSPQVRLKQNLSSTLSLTAAALYEMQYASQGPLGTINTYMKYALAPNLFVGLENKTSHWTNGVGVDFKSIKPDVKYVTSLSAVAYSQYVQSKFQLKAKATYGENLSDELMLGGYGVSKYATDSTTVEKYTNFNNLSTWLNIVYGTKIQVGVLVGLSQNLGTNEDLAARKGGKYTAYGYGYYDASQSVLDRLCRVAPQVSYNLPNVKFGLEYDFTAATYGTIKNNGRITNPYSVENHRILASICYYF